MKVCIVCYEDVDRWILGKFAKKMKFFLESHNIDVTISNLGSNEADINHHIIYSNYIHVSGTINTMMITHVDSLTKLERLKSNLKLANLGIAMSKDTADILLSSGISGNKLSYVLPAHDSLSSVNKIKIGLTCRVQEDGRKREYFLDRLAEVLNPNVFEFYIMGDNWENQVVKLQNCNFTIKYHKEFDYNTYHEIINNIDYYLYMGQDEGQMGFVDAVCAGKKIITTPQGYHCHFNSLIDYPFNTFDELLSIFKKIQIQKLERDTVISEWNWENYTMKHLDLWNKLLFPNEQINYNKEIYKSSDGILSNVEGKSLSWYGVQKFKLFLFFSDFKHKYYLLKKKIVK